MAPQAIYGTCYGNSCGANEEINNLRYGTYLQLLFIGRNCGGEESCLNSSIRHWGMKGRCCIDWLKFIS